MFLPKPDPAQQKAARSYVRAKARLLQKMGVSRFRSENPLKLPVVSLEPEVQGGLLHACGQLVAGRGFSMKKPLEGIDVAVCYALLETFHFQVVGRRSASMEEGILDRMQCQHRVKPEKIWVLYNLVAYDTPEPPR